MLLIAPGVALALGSGEHALSRSLAGSSGGAGGSPGSATLAGISGLSAWWDASTASGLLDANGVALPALGSGTVALIADQSGSNRPLAPVFLQVPGTWSASAAPRINGLLGGVGRPTGYSGVAPQLDPNLGFQCAGIAMGSAGAWTRYLVWTRPNLRLNSGQNSLPVGLLTAGSTVVLALDSVAGGRLVLFPGAAQTVLSQTMERRHTHAVIMRYAPGAGVDVWLDGLRVATGAPNPLPSSGQSPLTLLHDTTWQGSAQCWFNEAACWERSLSDSEVGVAVLAAARWGLGARRGINLLVVGQSNAGLGLNDGAWLETAQGVAWHLGAASYCVIGLYGSGSAYTCIGGHPIYNVRQPPGTGSIYLPGSFLNDPGDGSDPAGWSLGSPDGEAVQAYLAEQAADDVSDIAAILWPWSESDSTREYSELAYYSDGAVNLLGQLRTMLGKSAAQMPLVWWNAMPFWTDEGVQMVRVAMATLVANAGLNVICGMPMTADSNPLNGTDYNHLNTPDVMRQGMLAAGPTARAVLAASGGDTISAIPAGVPNAGPVITHAYRQSNTSIIVTIQHDAGNDVVLPGTAAQGTGWTVMDGGSLAAPGTLVSATACARVDATHLELTLSQALVSPSSGCLLLYPWGSTRIGTGNAVTDNAASVTPPAGWNIGSDLGSGWLWNFPLRATTAGVALSDSAT